MYTVSVTELFSAYLKIREYAYKHGKHAMHAPFIHVEIFFTLCVHTFSTRVYMLVWICGNWRIFCTHNSEGVGGGGKGGFFLY